MTDGDGNYGYRGADDSFIPFSSNVITNVYALYIRASSGSYTWNITAASEDVGRRVLIVYSCQNDSDRTANDWADNGLSCSGITLSMSPTKVQCGAIYAFGKVTSTNVSITSTKAVASGPDVYHVIVF